MKALKSSFTFFENNATLYLTIVYLGYAFNLHLNKNHEYLGWIVLLMATIIGCVIHAVLIVKLYKQKKWFHYSGFIFFIILMLICINNLQETNVVQSVRISGQNLSLLYVLFGVLIIHATIEAIAILHYKFANGNKDEAESLYWKNMIFKKQPFGVYRYLLWLLSK